MWNTDYEIEEYQKRDQERREREEMYYQQSLRDHMAEEEQRYYEECMRIAHMKETIGLLGDIIYKMMSYKDTFNAWLAEQPQVIQELATAYPPGTYKIKEDAPYAITNPGSKVLLISYTQSGQVGVVIKAEDKSKEAIEHEEMLCQRYKKTKEEAEQLKAADVSVHVDPQYLELVHNELDESAVD